MSSSYSTSAARFERLVERTSVAILPRFEQEVRECFADRKLIRLGEFLIQEWRTSVPLRGVLVRLGLQTGGTTFARARDAAAAVELAQLATLVIDDVIDQSSWRGGPSVLERFGSGVSVLAGEVLKTCATALFAERVLSRFASGRAALSEFESMYRAVCLGQMLDLEHERSTGISEQEYLKMIGLTTGRFLEGAIAVGGILSGCSGSKLTALRNFGYNAGLALQIYDDVFDLVPLAIHDKEFANDLKRRKQRLPWIHVCRTSTGGDRKRLKTLWKKRILSDRDTREIVNCMLERRSIPYCLRKARMFADRARRNVDRIGAQAPLLSAFIDMIQEDDEVLSMSLRRRYGTAYC